ncbi:DUF2779 domain-containing protein [Campylobacter lari]|uniref:DUF2779 domain-containing protein n=1 Tax=Campylobacter lari TaxID=201 RepID=UPI0021E6B171|nr:DUF2779 domain-containing protein [Campylobacter lari]
MLAYNASFEKGVIKNLALAFPKFCKHLLNIEKKYQRSYDTFFNKNHYKMQGSFIKKFY